MAIEDFGDDRPVAFCFRVNRDDGLSKGLAAADKPALFFIRAHRAKTIQPQFCQSDGRPDARLIVYAVAAAEVEIELVANDHWRARRHDHSAVPGSFYAAVD